MKSKDALLRLTDITHMMWAKDLFENVNAEIVWGQVVGLIWPNGVWKSTLINIMAGLIEPRSGTVEVEWEIELVRQWLDADLSLTVYEYVQLSRERDGKWPLEEREVMVALSKTWGKEMDIHLPLSTLSWWQRTLLRITQCLLDDIDILLLDEPTNHLDRNGIEFLQWVIKKFRGPVVIVSHDRQFLEDVCTDVFDLRWWNIEQYEGTYTKYIKERERRAVQQMRAREEQQEKKEKAEKWLNELRERASFRDSQASGRRIRARQKFFDRTFVDGKIEEIREENTMNMEVKWGEEKEKEMLELGHGMVWRTGEDWRAMNPIFLSTESYEAVEWQKNTLFQIQENLHLTGHDRIVIVGENWSGKTTLLKILQDNWNGIEWEKNTLINRWESIRLWWFSQHDDSLCVDERVMKWCLRMLPAGWDQEMITQKLGDANIPEEDLVKRMSELSHGQIMKIRFLQLMLHSYDLLILDEPTNHLDISTREELEVMLQQYEGAILIVSHDRRFVQQIGVETKWRIRDGNMEVMPWKKKYSDKGK